MNNFVYQNKTTIHFGKGVEENVGQEIVKHGYTKVLVVYGMQSVVKSGLLNKIKTQLVQHNLQHIEYGGVSVNPSKTHTLAGIDIAKQHKVDFVLAVGGGSVIDEAKAIAAGAVNEDIWNLFVNRPLGRNGLISYALPIGVVLTLPATGSENSIATVIRDDESGRKYSLGEECLRPTFAFINPQLSMTLPKEQIANGASDILSHMLERYFSPQEHVRATDYILASSIQALFEISSKLYYNSQDYWLWAEFCLLGTLAHNDMLSLGRTEQDWGTHIIENKFLSGVYNIAHGKGLSILFVAWLRYMANKRPAKVLQFCREVMGVQADNDSDTMDKGIQKLIDFYKSLDLPVLLSEVGIRVHDVQGLARDFYNNDTSLGAYGRINLEDINKILELSDKAEMSQ